MYGVLYAISSEIFPAIHRGTGNCLTSTAKGVFGVMASLLVITDSDVSVDDDLTGADHCAVCEFVDSCARVHCRRLASTRWLHSPFAAV